MNKLYMFVYGTLKKGYGNDRHLCRGYKEIIEGEISGKLYDLGAFPMAEIEGAALALRGTTNIAKDLNRTLDMEIPAGLSVADPTIKGEIVVFEEEPDETLSRLVGFDRLEGFSGDNSFYERVLVLAKGNDGTERLCWTYRCPNGGVPRGSYLDVGIWPKELATK